MDTGLTVVRKLPLGVVASVAVHAALGAFVYAYDPGERPDPEPEPLVFVEIVEPPSMPPPPPPPRVEPQLQLRPRPAAKPEPLVAGPDERPLRRDPPEEISTTARATIETASPAAIDPGTTPPPRSAWFDLRRGRGPAVDLRLPQGRGDVDYVPRGTDADPGVARTGQLQESGGGTHRSEQGPFTAKVAPDGGVTLKDRRNFQFGLRPPTPKSIAKGVTQWFYGDKGPDGQRGERTLEKAAGGSTDAGDRSKAVIVPVAGGSFDITDAFMRGKGHDPYASKKLAFLDSTRDERVQIGTKHRERQLLLTPQIVQRNLDRAWQQAGDTRARREALFELWDEVVEAGDAKAVEAGLAARKLVVGFIRARLPASGPDAYTAGELAALNQRRQSKAPFAPYE